MLSLVEITAFRLESKFDFSFFQIFQTCSIFQPFLSLCLFVNFCESGAHSYHFYGQSTSSPILKIGMCWGHLSSMGLIPTVLFLKYKKYEVSFTTYLFQNVISYLPSVCPNWMLYCTLLGYLSFWEKKRFVKIFHICALIHK